MNPPRKRFLIDQARSVDAREGQNCSNRLAAGDHPASLGENRQLRYNGAALAKDSWRLPQSQA
jgi:hypothetical protein